MSPEELLKRLPSHYAKDPDSNNYKAFSLVARGIQENEELYATIRKYWDVDQAEGKGLDRLGKDEGISRGSYDDETYRKMIKIQYLVNMSEGDIEAINTILTAYMGEDFLGLEEGWTSRYKEPASLVIEAIPSSTDFPLDLMQRIKAAGVGFKVVKIMNSKQRFAIAGLSGETTTIYPWTPNEIELKLQKQMASAFQSVETFTVYPAK